MSQLNAKAQADPAIFPAAGHDFIYVGLDGILRTMDDTGTVKIYSFGGGGGNTIYTGDDTVTSNRTVTLGGKTLAFANAAKNLLSIDPTTLNFGFGDIDGAGNGENILINDPGNVIYIGDSNGINNGVYFGLQTGFFFVGNQVNNFLIVNPTTKLYEIGDRGNTTNGNALKISDTPQTLQLGNTVAGNSGLFLNVDPATETADITFGGNSALKINVVAHTYALGDIDAGTNGTTISINDTAQTVNISNIPVFDDNAAALLGGLVIGDIYRITVPGDALAIVH